MRFQSAFVCTLVAISQTVLALHEQGARRSSVSSSSSAEHNPNSPQSENGSSAPGSTATKKDSKPTVDETPQSVLKESAKEPSFIADTTGALYNNDWLKPDQKKKIPKFIDTPAGARHASPIAKKADSVKLPGTPKRISEQANKPRPFVSPKTPKGQVINPAQQPPSVARKTEDSKLALKPSIPLTPNQQRLKAKIQAEQTAKADETEAERKKLMQGKLDAGKFGPVRPDHNWTPPKADTREQLKNGKKGKPAYLLSEDHDGRTPYHPTKQSSGKLETTPRDHQYSGKPGTPRIDPRFHKYVNNEDPYDRSYVRIDRVKGPDGIEKVAGSGIFDASSSPHHSVNKLDVLVKHPEFTYATPAQPGANHRAILNEVLQTYDEGRIRPNGKKVANPRDEFPFASTEVTGPDGKPLSKAERKKRTNVVPVPDRESRAEGKLLAATHRAAEYAQQQQNIENLHRGIPTQQIHLGVGVIKSDEVRLDLGHGRKGHVKLPSPPSQRSSPSPPLSPSTPSRQPPNRAGEAGPSNPRPARAQSLTSSDIERLQQLQLDTSDEEQFPPLPKAAAFPSTGPTASSHKSGKNLVVQSTSSLPSNSPPSSPEPVALSKKEGKKAKKYKRSLEMDFETVTRRWLRRQSMEIEQTRKRRMIERRELNLQRRELINKYRLLQRMVASM